MAVGTHETANIDGEWVEADSNDSIEVDSPIDGTVLDEVPDGSAQDVRSAVGAARRVRSRTGGDDRVRARGRARRRDRAHGHRSRGDVRALTPVVRAESYDDAIEIANRSRYGLQAAIFTDSLERAHDVANRLQAGGVFVNETNNYWERLLPFGGYGESGSGGRYGSK